MKQKLCYFPPQTSKEGYKNPYSQNYQECLQPYYDILNSKPQGIAQRLPLGTYFLFSSTKADIYIINWLESVCFLRAGGVQFLCAILGILFVILRKKKIIWMFHNIHPHQGDNFMSRILQNMLYKYANLIISHSKEAYEYAQKRAKCKVIYKCHPIKIIKTTETFKVDSCDVLIWGEILPYKGIVEFLDYINNNHSQLKIRIVGKCNDKILDTTIKSKCTPLIKYENRRASFSELKCIINNSNYVLFPYIGNCVSSSGALIDSIAMGGNVMGPNRGAFNDLASEKMCIVYNDYAEMLKLLNTPPQISKVDINIFYKKNSWESFGKFIYEEISKQTCL